MENSRKKQQTSKGEGLYRKKLTSWKAIFLREDFKSSDNSLFQDKVSYNLCYVNQNFTYIKTTPYSEYFNK